MTIKDVIRGVEIKYDNPKHIGHCDRGYNSLASAEVVVDREKIKESINSALFYLGHIGSTLNDYDKKVIENYIATAIESGAIIRLKEKE